MTDSIIITLIALAVALEIAGIVLALDAIMRGRTPHGTLAWALVLIFLPPLGIFLYLSVGARKLDGYIKAHRRGTQALDSLAELANKAMEPFRVSAQQVAEQTCSIGVATASEQLATTNWTTGNTTRLLVDGVQTFEAILDELEQAQRYICVQFYIVRDDELGQRFHKAMIQAANRGVSVRLLYDALGSNGLPESFIDELIEAKIRVASFQTNLGMNPLRMNFRNHRKIVMIDGHTAFIGGHNIGREYLGRDPDMGAWRDTHIRVQGPAALAAQLAFCEDWNWSTGEVPTLDWSARSYGNEHVLVIPSGPSDEVETCALLFHQVIEGAQRRLWIASPYFVPDEGIVLSLQLAAMRGVDARILIPNRFDERMIMMSAYSYYEDVLPSGVGIYRYLPAFLHHKVFMVDDLVSVGTANFDNRSFRINFEITVLVANSPLRDRVQEMMAHDFENSQQAKLEDFTKRSWFFRAMARTCRLMSPLQ